MEMKSFLSYDNVWFEITKSSHGHGGPGWEFGTCLWSPSKDRSGRDRYRTMREAQSGDLVLHYYEDRWPDGALESRLCGRSIVASPHHEVFTQPPTPGDWAGRPSYYRVDLRGYEQFSSPLPHYAIRTYYDQDILEDIEANSPRHYPFNSYGKTIRAHQGEYLSRCTPALYTIFLKALKLQELEEGTAPQSNAHAEYEEGRRRHRESYVFTRNPQLARQAKELYDYRCQACKFHFSEAYGELGEG